MKRLGLTTPCVAASTPLPGDASASRIVHFGFGQFARAHLAVYTQAAVTTDDPWRITAVNLHSSETRDMLEAQGYVYTVLAKDRDSHALNVISVVDQALCPKAGDIAALEAVLTAPQTHIVSLTITEKAYLLDQNGNLDLTHKDIRHDLQRYLQQEGAPITVIGWLVWAAARRKQQGLSPLTYLALDNLNHKGRKLQQAVVEFAAQIDPELAEYIDGHCCFPASMVDRIVPARTSDQKTEVAELVGAVDEACAVTEGFHQWVVEDHFVGVRPDWQRGGVQLCQDITPFEQMKLRLLNGAHSAIAYLGCLVGHQTVADVMADPVCRGFIERLMVTEIRPAVTEPQGVSIDAYIGALLERFCNPHLHHQLSQIAMDGSQKIPQRWLPVMQQRRNQGQDAPLLCACLAFWVAFVQSSATISDPKAAELRQIDGMSPVKAVAYLFASPGLLSDTGLTARDRQAIVGYLESIEQQGARKTLQNLI